MQMRRKTSKQMLSWFEGEDDNDNDDDNDDDDNDDDNDDDIL